MRLLQHSFLLSAVLLVSCAPSSIDHVDHGNMDRIPSKELSVQDQSSMTEIAFAVVDDGQVFAEYGVSHTKEMHLIVVRDDLRHFQHLHPVRDVGNVWRVFFTAPAGGIYWLYADFVDSHLKSYTLRFERTYPGDPGEYGTVKNFDTQKNVDGYSVTMESHIFADGIQFNFDIMDQSGAPAKLDEYLGEKGHSILLSEEGDFVHTHPYKEYVGYSEADPPVFVTPKLSAPFYRVFTQFKIAGKVITAVFDWKQ